MPAKAMIAALTLFVVLTLSVLVIRTGAVIILMFKHHPHGTRAHFR